LKNHMLVSISKCISIYENSGKVMKNGDRVMHQSEQ
jgi:hypothetical protein